MKPYMSTDKDTVATQADDNSSLQKKVYSSPSLIKFGKVGELTQAGSAGGKESTRNVGPAFMV